MGSDFIYDDMGDRNVDEDTHTLKGQELESRNLGEMKRGYELTVQKHEGQISGCLLCDV